MANTDKLSDLVQTVRQLNWEVRPKISATEGGNDPGSPLHSALADIRNNEIQTSQLIRGMSLAETAAEQDVGRVVDTIDSGTISSRQLLSEFATAREAILSILRNLSEEDWALARDTPTGEQSYGEIVDKLIASDQQHVAKILGASS